MLSPFSRLYVRTVWGMMKHLTSKSNARNMFSFSFYTPRIIFMDRAYLQKRKILRG